MMIMDGILRNTARESTAKVELWEQNFDYVANQVFPGRDEQSKALKLALHTYLESRLPDERNFGLAKLLIASGTKSENENEEESNQKIGKGIKAFLESIGPAGIKLGQALSAVPDIPNYIRDNLKDFMSNAARPARWEVYDWLDVYKTPKEAQFIDNFKLGPICGSASFFVTLFAGQNDVVKILRLAAKPEAENEMKYILDTLEKLMKNEEQVLGQLGPTLLRIVEQAQSAIKDETDLKIGERQYKIAEKLYPNAVEVNGFHFNVKEAKWYEHGEKWARLERMPGIEVDKVEDPEYRKAASVAYVSIELLNIFSGKKFDWDRHMGQMKLDPKTSTLGLFDTGSMLLKNPIPEDQKALGTILYRTLENALGADKPKDFAKALTEEIDNFYKESKQPSSYITQVQRGLLALSGYYKDFSVSDFAQCIDIAFNNHQVKVSKHVMSAFVSEMLEKTGLLKKKDDAKIIPEEVAKEKENFGRLLFNLYAASQVSEPDSSMGKILEAESQAFQKTKMPVLGRIFFKKKSAINSFGNIRIPSCFGKHIAEALKDKQIDPIIAKGAMKEAYENICLIDRKNRDTPEVKRELGKQLYSLFVSTRGKDKKQDEIMQEVKQKLHTLSEKSVLARNLYGIMSLSEYVSSKKDIDIKEIIWDVISQENLDKDILKGIRSSMREKGHFVSSLMLHFRKPLSKIRKIRNVFSLFKKSKEPEHGYLQSLLGKAVDDVVNLPEKLAIKKTQKGELLMFLTGSSKAEGILLAPKNRIISYKAKTDSKPK